uniref:Uncharacterized protein n=1 Tax=Tetranychus urticae TaxID=32264 RepID=T1KTA1_TETUR
MRINSFKKVQRIKVSNRRGFRSKSKVILNQPTLIASICCLMANQKLVLIVLRIKKSGSNEETIPLGLKIDSDKIPKGFKPLEIHANNLVEIIIDGVDPIPGLIVAIGEDSQDLMSQYAVFADNVKDLSIPTLSPKIVHWLGIENILIHSIKATALPAVKHREFDAFLKRAEAIKKISLKRVKKPIEKPEVVTISDSQEPQKSDVIESKYFENPSVSSLIFHVKDRIQTLKSNLQTFPISTGCEHFFDQTIKVFDKLVDIIEISNTNIRISDCNQNVKVKIEQVDGINVIPEDDRTFEKNKITYIEGSLPVATKNYTKALNSLPKKYSERESTIVLASLVKFCFPVHWVKDVTLRGSGGRSSLITLWNHENPLTNPCSGTFTNGLGENRLRCLLDHAVRNCNKKTYDQAAEKLLITQLSKVMHYARTKILDLKKVPGLRIVTKSDFEDDAESVSEEELMPKPKDRSKIPKNAFESLLTESGFDNLKSSQTPGEDEADDDRSLLKSPFSTETIPAGHSPSDEFGDNHDPITESKDNGENLQQGAGEKEEMKKKESFQDDDNSISNTSPKPVETLDLTVRVPPLEQPAEDDSFESASPNKKARMRAAFEKFSKQLETDPIQEPDPSKDFEVHSGDSDVEKPDDLTNQPGENQDKSESEEELTSEEIAILEKAKKKASAYSKYFTSTNVKRVKNPKNNNLFDDLITENEFPHKKKKVDQNPKPSTMKPPSLESFLKKSTISKNVTTIVEVNGSGSKEKDVDLTLNLNDGLLYAVLLPLIMDKDHKPMKQPILVKLKVTETTNNIDMPFCDYLNQSENYYQIQLNGINLTVQILAIGCNPLSVRADLQANMAKNPLWSDLKKMIKLDSTDLQLEHKPLEDEDDIPNWQILGSKMMNTIFTESNEFGKSSQAILNPDDRAKKDSQKDKNDDESNSSQKFTGIEKQAKQITTKPLSPALSAKSATASPYISEKEPQMDLPDKEVILQKLTSDFKELDKKVAFLSQFDTTGSIILSMINIMRNLHEVIIEKDRSESMTANIVPEKDSTYKIIQKNQIFIEGLIQLDLDRYESAIRRSKPGNPCSYAYQIIKFSFPESYYKNITLGKRNYDERELENIIKSKEDGKNVKLPLVYLWGFKDPYAERMIGSFEFRRGQERIRAFLNHLFRKAEIYKYSDSFENKVRARIQKELCSRNKPFTEEKSSEDSETESPFSKESLSNSNENFLKTWDSKCFSDFQ